MKLFSGLLLFVVVSSMQCSSQSPNLTGIAKNILSKDTSQDISGYLEPKMKYLLNRSYTRYYNFEDFQQIYASDDEAVVSVVVIDSTKEKINSYLYFDHQQTWKLRDLRQFRLYYIPVYRKLLESITDKQIDSVIEFAREDPKRDLFFRTREEYQWKLFAFRLCTATDAELVKYFGENKNNFHDMAAKIFTALVNNDHVTKNSTGDIDFSVQYAEMIHKLALEKIELESKDFFPGCLNFQIVKTGDYGVGFIRVPDGKSPPLIDRKRLMMLRQVDENWYLYRTNWTME